MGKITSTPHHHFANFFKNEKEIHPFAYAVSLQLEQGSVCVNLNEQPKKIFDGYEERDSEINLEKAHKVLAAHSLVGTKEDKEKPFILEGQNFYITRYFNYETQIIEGINALIQSGAAKKQERLQLLKDLPEFRELVKQRDLKRAVDWQLIAAALAFVNNFSIITGGPGTGKTTTVAKVLSLLYAQDSDLQIKLAAPTGKAAMRMKEALTNNEQIPEGIKETIANLQPFTLHRLLGPIYQSPYFKHHNENPVDADVIIVDEASMIDVALFAKLISAVSANTRLIVLGDQNQLASVEAGSLLGDLCNTVDKLNHFSTDLNKDLQELLPELNLSVNNGADQLLQDHIVELKHSWRFDDYPEFRELSEAIINNRSEAIEDFFMEKEGTGPIVIDQEYDETKFKGFIKGYEDFIAEDDIRKAIELFNSMRILAVIRKGKNGVEGLNERVEKHLAKKGKINLQQVFYENRPVMVTQNHPDLNLFNGDVGIVRKDKETGKMRIWFLYEEKQLDEPKKEEDEQKKKIRGFSPGLLTDVETVFAMTVHKSQGSEFEKVLLVMPKSEELPLLTRELLYTGITRAKESLLIQGTKELIKKSAQVQVRRASGIKNRI